MYYVIVKKIKLIFHTSTHIFIEIKWLSEKILRFYWLGILLTSKRIEVKIKKVYFLSMRWIKLLPGLNENRCQNLIVNLNRGKFY